MASLAFKDFVESTKSIQSFDLKNPDGDTFTIYWKEMDGQSPAIDIKDFVKEISMSDMSEEEKTFAIVRKKWNAEALIKINLGMEAMGLETISEAEWDLLPPSYMEVIMGKVGSVNANFFDGSKKVPKP